MQRRLAGVSALGARNNELASEGFKDEVQALPVVPRSENGMPIGPGAVGPSKSAIFKSCILLDCPCSNVAVVK